MGLPQRALEGYGSRCVGRYVAREPVHDVALRWSVWLEESEKYHINMLGKHQVYTALSAIETAKLLGIEDNEKEVEELKVKGINC